LGGGKHKQRDVSKKKKSKQRDFVLGQKSYRGREGGAGWPAKRTKGKVNCIAGKKNLIEGRGRLAVPSRK